MSPLLSVHGLGLIRGERRLFKNIEFALAAGELLVIEGANGSGKTSLMRVLAGLMDADEGEVRWQGAVTAKNRQQFRANLVWYGHRTGCKQDLTPEENLRCEQALRPQSAHAMSAALQQLGVSGLSRLPMRALSAGQQRRVALARLLLTAAPLWLIDEPFTNLDKAGQMLVEALLAEHLDRGGICVMASHRGVTINVPQQKLVLQ